MKYFILYCFCFVAVFYCERDVDLISGTPASPVPEYVIELVNTINTDQEEQDLELASSDVEFFETLLNQRLDREGLTQIDPRSRPYLPAPGSAVPGENCEKACAALLPDLQDYLQEAADENCRPLYDLVSCCGKNKNGRYILLISKPGC